MRVLQRRNWRGGDMQSRRIKEGQRPHELDDTGNDDDAHTKQCTVSVEWLIASNEYVPDKKLTVQYIKMIFGDLTRWILNCKKHEYLARTDELKYDYCRWMGSWVCRKVAEIVVPGFHRCFVQEKQWTIWKEGKLLPFCALRLMYVETTLVCLVLCGCFLSVAFVDL